MTRINQRSRRAAMKKIGLAMGGSFILPFSSMLAAGSSGKYPKLKNPLTDSPGMSDSHALIDGD